jgi:surface protein
LSSLLTTRVEDMSEMFDDCRANKIDCASFDTRNVKNMDCMFHDARVEELDLSGFNTSKVMNMDLMFSGCDVKLLNIKNFSMENVETHQYMFGGCEAKLIAKDKKVIDIYKQDTELEVSDFDYRDLPDILNARLENLDVDMSIIETIKECTNCQLIKHLWALSVSELCYETGLLKEDVEKVLDEMEKIANISETSLRRLNEHIGRCRKKLLSKIL